MFDQKKIEEAVLLLLEGIGEDVTREGLLDTPKRVAKMYQEIMSGLEESPKEHLERTFTVEHSDMVMEKEITFYSVCEHHLLPFFGKVHIAYIPDGKVVGLSKLARTVEVYAKRPQIQEQLTNQIVEALMEYLKPFGAMVVIEAEHMCMSMRGVNKPGTKTVTLAHRGVFTEKKELRDQFFELLRI